MVLQDSNPSLPLQVACLLQHPPAGQPRSPPRRHEVLHGRGRPLRAPGGGPWPDPPRHPEREWRESPKITHFRGENYVHKVHLVIPSNVLTSYREAIALSGSGGATLVLRRAVGVGAHVQLPLPSPPPEAALRHRFGEHGPPPSPRQGFSVFEYTRTEELTSTIFSDNI